VEHFNFQMSRLGRISKLETLEASSLSHTDLEYSSYSETCESLIAKGKEGLYEGRYSEDVKLGTDSPCSGIGWDYEIHKSICKGLST
jgi:hypothetical protein